MSRVGADRQTRQALLGPSGALSAGAAGATRSLADIGAVVQGVNDQPAPDQLDADNGARDDGADPELSAFGGGARRTASPRRALRRAGRCAGRQQRQAGGERRYRGADADRPIPARGRALLTLRKARRLDPLLNTTYDLNFPKVVPVLK